MNSTRLDLLDYRRQVAEAYRVARTSGKPPSKRWERFRAERERLFRQHPQSALSSSQKARFAGLPYFPYDPTMRFELPVDFQVERIVLDMPLEEDGLIELERFGRIHFAIGNKDLSLSVYWILGYGGALFLPFRDLTHQADTYGGGRYLIDTIKGADLGGEGTRLVVDFNYAYNPSCAYNVRWHCPLAPPENWLTVPVQAGEQRYPDPE